jgi:hypothetical protein
VSASNTNASRKACGLRDPIVIPLSKSSRCQICPLKPQLKPNLTTLWSWA